MVLMQYSATLLNEKKKKRHLDFTARGAFLPDTPFIGKERSEDEISLVQYTYRATVIL